MTYQYIYQENPASPKTFLLLHGTGGNEENLLSIARFLNPDYNVLALRGDVNENGSLRFFKREGHGNYDMDDLRARGKNMLAFLEDWSQESGIALENLVPVGFSNGANMILHLLLTEDTPFQKAALLSPMYPEEVDVKNLEGVKVFASMGKEDPIMSMEDNEHVKDLLEEAQADLHIHWGQGHEITVPILRDAQEFLELK